MNRELKYFNSRYPNNSDILNRFYKIEPNLLRFLDEYELLHLLRDLLEISPLYPDILNRGDDPPAFYYDRISNAIGDLLKEIPNHPLKQFLLIRDIDFQKCFPWLSDNDPRSNN